MYFMLELKKMTILNAAKSEIYCIIAYRLSCQYEKIFIKEIINAW